MQQLIQYHRLQSSHSTHTRGFVESFHVIKHPAQATNHFLKIGTQVAVRISYEFLIDSREFKYFFQNFLGFRRTKFGCSFSLLICRIDISKILKFILESRVPNVKSLV